MLAKSVSNVSNCRRLVTGTVIVFDELLNYCGFESHEFLALFELVKEFKLQFEWLGVKDKRAMQAALVVL